MTKDEITLFSLNTDKNTSKFILNKALDRQVYEMIYADRNNAYSELRIYIDPKISYIFAITFKNDKIFKNTIKTRYIKDTENKFYSGLDIQIKNFKKENIIMYFGCELNKKQIK